MKMKYLFNIYYFCLTTDFVLVHVEEEKKQTDLKFVAFREKFLSNLKKSHMQMEEVCLYI